MVRLLITVFDDSVNRFVTVETSIFDMKSSKEKHTVYIFFVSIGNPCFLLGITVCVL